VTTTDLNKLVSNQRVLSFGEGSMLEADSQPAATRHGRLQGRNCRARRSAGRLILNDAVEKVEN
jgi:hypothetical protein